MWCVAHSCACECFACREDGWEEEEYEEYEEGEEGEEEWDEDGWDEEEGTMRKDRCRKQNTLTPSKQTKAERDAFNPHSIPSFLLYVKESIACRALPPSGLQPAPLMLLTAMAAQVRNDAAGARH